MSLKEQLAGKKYGEIIMDLHKVEVVEVFPMREGEGQYGPWSFQDCTLSDGVSGTFANMVDASSFKGKVLNLESRESKSHGFKGIKLKLNKWTDKDGNANEKTVLEMTGMCKFTDEAGHEVFPTGVKGTKTMAKVDYTPEELFELYEYWFDKTNDGAASAKLVGCSMVIKHKIDSPSAGDVTHQSAGPSFTDEDIPF